MLRMKLFNVFGCLLLAATGLHARDWGFSKDTVYEYDVSYEPLRPGYDSVHLTNEDSDSLNIDSVWVEVVKPENPERFFHSVTWGPGTSPGFPNPYWGKYPIYDDRGNVNDSVAFIWPAETKMGPGMMTLRHIQLDGYLKNQLILPPSNRIVLRSIFRAKDRGYDTLMVVGDYKFCVSICPTNSTVTAPRKKISKGISHKPLRVDGRRMTKPSK